MIISILTLLTSQTPELRQAALTSPESCSLEGRLSQWRNTQGLIPIHWASRPGPIHPGTLTSRKLLAPAPSTTHPCLVLAESEWHWSWPVKWNLGSLIKVWCLGEGSQWGRRQCQYSVANVIWVYFGCLLLVSTLSMTSFHLPLPGLPGCLSSQAEQQDLGTLWRWQSDLFQKHSILWGGPEGGKKNT